MKIKTALDLKKEKVVTLVGGGGKTTTLLRIAHEVSEEIKPVIFTTTTKIRISEGRKTDRLLIIKGIDDLEEIVKINKKTITLASGFVEEIKLNGVASEVVDKLSKFEELPLILVEGDGADTRSFKTPVEHEPVIPQSTNLVIPVVGIDVIGKPLTSKYVHRAKSVSKLTGAEMGQPVTPELIAKVITHDKGGLKSVPQNARVIPLLNKAEKTEEVNLAEKTAERILEFGLKRIEKVMIGKVREEDPIIKIIE